MNNMKHRTFHLLLAIFLFCAYCNAQELGKHDFIKHGLFYIDIKNPGYDSTAIRLPGKTYAVIINGSKDLKSNRESYWNDCSFLYTTLRNYYKIPRTNISVIMSDGKDPGADITMEDNSVVSSLLDLDGDGTDDIDYAATKENIKAVFSRLSNRIYSRDHLLVFIVGHGYKDKASYISLWGNEDNLYPQELSDYVKDIKAGYITFVLGQCFSGGFIDALKADNRLILVACGKDEKSWTRPDIPYDEFVSLFTSALSHVNIFDEEVDADYDKDGVVTLLEAYRYAEENDGYNDGDFSFGGVREHPMASYLAGTNIEDLSLSYIPNPVELIFSDGSGQGKAPWATDAIALSPESDGMDWTNSNSDFSQSTDKSVVLKVRNRGVLPYDKANKSVSLY